MDMITATNSFRHLGKWLVLLIGIMIIGSGCHSPTEVPTFGKEKDITEDLYHRLKAGIFEPDREPVICQIWETPSLIDTIIYKLKMKKLPQKIVRISWERGTFHVQSDDLNRVVIYMDEETLFSHVQASTIKGLNLGLRFFEIIEHPIR